MAARRAGMATTAFTNKYARSQLHTVSPALKCNGKEYVAISYFDLVFRLCMWPSIRADITEVTFVYNHMLTFYAKLYLVGTHRINENKSQLDSKHQRCFQRFFEL